MNRKHLPFHQLSKRSKRRYANTNSILSNSDNNQIVEPSSSIFHSNNYIPEKSNPIINDESNIEVADELIEDNKFDHYFTSSSDNNIFEKDNFLLDIHSNVPLVSDFLTEINDNQNSASGIKHFLRTWAIKHNITARYCNF